MIKYSYEDNPFDDPQAQIFADQAKEFGLNQIDDLGDMAADKARGYASEAFDQALPYLGGLLGLYALKKGVGSYINHKHMQYVADRAAKKTAEEIARQRLMKSDVLKTMGKKFIAMF